MKITLNFPYLFMSLLKHWARRLRIAAALMIASIHLYTHFAIRLNIAIPLQRHA